jgi:hypothetical protein
MWLSVNSIINGGRPQIEADMSEHMLWESQRQGKEEHDASCKAFQVWF